MYIVFIRMSGESYCVRLGSLLLYLCDFIQALINSLVCCFLSQLFFVCFVLFVVFRCVTFSTWTVMHCLDFRHCLILQLVIYFPQFCAQLPLSSSA